MSRRMRKLMKIRKKQPLTTEGLVVYRETVLPKTEKSETKPSPTRGITIRDYANNLLAKRAKVRSEPPKNSSDYYASFDEAKSQEIFRHLKTVLTVSVACLLILTLLYYFERQYDWVNLINLKIKDVLANWNW